MNTRIGLLVLAALCAIAFGAVAASGASAGITGYACIEGKGDPGLPKFSDADCTETQSEGKFGHVAFPPGETTQLTLKAIGANTILKTKIALTNVTMEATEGLECTGCHVSNVAGPPMATTGSGGRITYKGVTISVASCKVKGKMIKTEPLSWSVTMNEEGMTFLTEVKPESGEVQAVIELEPSGGEPCALGSSIVVKGKAIGKATGAKAKFATGAGELTVGTQKAEMIGEMTLSGGPTEGTHNPVGATTTAT